jgi:hypothetical protein
MRRTGRTLLSTCLGLSLATILGACQLGGQAPSASEKATPAAAASPDNLTAADWKPVGDALAPGTLMPGGVYRIGMPRSDLEVTLNGVVLQPGFALGSYAAFVRHGSQAMAMGDLVLLEDEVGGVAAKLLQAGIEVTAIHNHLVSETPHVLYVHFLAQGAAVKIAEQLRSALAGSGTPFGAPSSAAPHAATIDGPAIDQVLGHQGKVSGSIYQVSVGRAQPVTLGGVILPPATGVTTAINIEAIPDGQAATTGDFALTPDEVDGVIGALRANGIEVTAVHSHMLMDAPHLLYVHWFGHGDAMTLARGLRAALDKTNSAR